MISFLFCIFAKLSYKLYFYPNNMSFESLSESVFGTESKSDRYRTILKALPDFTAPGVSDVSTLNNVLALVHQSMSNLWTGFYFVDDPSKEEPGLFLGFFQGAPACDLIAYGKGVCGTALKTGEPQIVADVDLFPGHIACSSASKSEIVVPLKDKEGRVYGVLDLDSAEPEHYDEEDLKFLEEVLSFLSTSLRKVYLSII